MIKYFIGLVCLFILDRLSKIYFLKNSLAINQGIAFSWALPFYILYPLLAIALGAVVFFWLKNLKNKNILKWPWGLVLIGAVSNILDRVSYGGVVDFINIPYFTVFNLSDIFIVSGILWIFIQHHFCQKSLISKKNL